MQRPTDRVKFYQRRAEWWAAGVDFQSARDQNVPAESSKRSGVVKSVRINHMTPAVGRQRSRWHTVPRRFFCSDLLAHQHNRARPRRLVHRHERTTDAVRGLNLQPFGAGPRSLRALSPPTSQKLRAVYYRARVTIKHKTKNDAADSGRKTEPQERAGSLQKHPRRVDRLDVLEHSHTHTVTNRTGARHVVQRELPRGHFSFFLGPFDFFGRDFAPRGASLKDLTRKRARRVVFDCDTLGLKEF